MSTSAEGRRLGRPPKTEAGAVPTRDRIVLSGAEAFSELGYEATTLTHIAEGCGLSAPAIYNHFATKDEVLLEVARWVLYDILAPQDGPMEHPRDAARRHLSAEFASVRRIVLELHLASFRHPDLAALLREWHQDHADRSVAARGSLATEKVFYLMLLGLAQIDALSTLEVPDDELLERANRMIDALFPLEEYPYE